jgi:hypothetical protein
MIGEFRLAAPTLWYLHFCNVHEILSHRRLDFFHGATAPSGPGPPIIKAS